MVPDFADAGNSLEDFEARGKPNFFRKHPILTGIGGLGAVGVAANQVPYIVRDLGRGDSYAMPEGGEQQQGAPPTFEEQEARRQEILNRIRGQQ